MIKFLSRALSHISGAHLSDARLTELLNFLSSDVDLSPSDEARVRAIFTARLQGAYYEKERELKRKFFIRALLVEQVTRAQLAGKPLTQDQLDLMQKEKMAGYSGPRTLSTPAE